MAEGKQCPDCVREGNDAIQPADNFTRKKSSRYKHGYRLSTYCRRHESMRNAARQAERLKTSDVAREKKRAADIKHAQTQSYRERHAANSRKYRQQHPDRVAEQYATWLAKNREKRRASQQAWLERRRHRGRIVSPPPDPSVAKIAKEIAERDRDLQKDE